MLVRCKHCSEVYPSDRGRCPKCKTPYAPPPTPPAPPPASNKAKTIAACSAVLGVMFSVIFFTTGIMLVAERIASILGIIFCFVATICIIVAAIGMISMKRMHDANERSESTVSQEEYEQLIRDFINRNSK